jgi:hypothetical protein
MGSRHEASFQITLAFGANKIVIKIQWFESAEKHEETITLTVATDPLCC